MSSAWVVGISAEEAREEGQVELLAVGEVVDAAESSGVGGGGSSLASSGLRAYMKEVS